MGKGNVGHHADSRCSTLDLLRGVGPDYDARTCIALSDRCRHRRPRQQAYLEEQREHSMHGFLVGAICQGRLPGRIGQAMVCN